ncbi:MAG: hypothetical protein ACFFAE_14105 [Candidatus Hodarchaeota archaeon]
MGNEEFRRNHYSDQQKQLDPSEPADSETSPTVDSHSKEIQKLQDQVQKLQHQLATSQIESQEKEKKLETQLYEQKTEFEAKSEELFSLEEKLKMIKSESQKQIQEKTEQIITLELEVQGLKNDLITAKEKNQELKTTSETTQKMINTLQAEKTAYLNQIAKMQDLIQQTEEEIKEIEASHLEVQDQLKLEISRMEERTGQMREDLARESTGTLARDRHIRVVLQQTELGRILLFLVDYFENTKKRSLALDTLSTEVGIPPIICRTHLRHLHELAVCEFNELTREIKLIKRAR